MTQPPVNRKTDKRTTDDSTKNHLDRFRSHLWLTLGSVMFAVSLSVFVWRAANVLLLFMGLLLAVALRALSRPLVRLTWLPDGRR